MQLKTDIYGQAFSFFCGKHRGHYGLELAKIVLNTLEEKKVNDYCEYFSGNMPIWSSDYVFVLFLKNEVSLDWWEDFGSKIRAKIKGGLIEFNWSEYAEKKSMKPSYLGYNGTFLLKDGLVSEIYNADKIESKMIVWALKESSKINKNVWNIIKNIDI